MFDPNLVNFFWVVVGWYFFPMMSCRRLPLAHTTTITSNYSRVWKKGRIFFGSFGHWWQAMPLICNLQDGELAWRKSEALRWLGVWGWRPWLNYFFGWGEGNNSTLYQLDSVWTKLNDNCEYRENYLICTGNSMYTGIWELGMVFHQLIWALLKWDPPVGRVISRGGCQGNRVSGDRRWRSVFVLAGEEKSRTEQ